MKGSKSMRCLALITARAGSVRLPKKNLMSFNGRPLIEWTVKAAHGVGDMVSRFVVSTDCIETAKVCQALGCDVPFMRPADLSSSSANSLDVVRHCIHHLETVDGDNPYDWILLLQPTSPLRTSEDILAALKIAQHEDVTSVIGVCEVVDSHPQKLKTISGNRLKSYVGQTFQQVRSQDLSPTVYRTNGAIYLTRRDIIMERQEFYGEQPAPLIMPPDRSIDIDTEFDFYMASQIMARKFEGKPTC
tara:strand:+ start:396 stop:1133 length:738 start_codon:yes stop_codon:yes gene_type:complete